MRLRHHLLAIAATIALLLSATGLAANPARGADHWSPVYGDLSPEALNEFMRTCPTFEKLCEAVIVNNTITNGPLRQTVYLLASEILMVNDSRERNCKIASDLLHATPRLGLTDQVIKDFRPFLLFRNSLQSLNISGASIGVDHGDGTSTDNRYVLRYMTPYHGGKLRTLTASGVFSGGAWCPFNGMRAQFGPQFDEQGRQIEIGCS